MVESTIRYSKSGSSDIASNIRYQTPLMLQRLKRRNTPFQSPNASEDRAKESPYARSKHALHEHPVVAPGGAFLVRPTYNQGASAPKPRRSKPNDPSHP